MQCMLPEQSADKDTDAEAGAATRQEALYASSAPGGGHYIPASDVILRAECITDSTAQVKTILLPATSSLADYSVLWDSGDMCHT